MMLPCDLDSCSDLATISRPSLLAYLGTVELGPGWWDLCPALAWLTYCLPWDPPWMLRDHTKSFATDVAGCTTHSLLLFANYITSQLFWLTYDLPLLCSPPFTEALHRHPSIASRLQRRFISYFLSLCFSCPGAHMKQNEAEFYLLSFKGIMVLRILT